MSLKNSSNGKILKINAFHYRVYQKDNRVRFELEMKHRQTKSVQDYLFNNQLETFLSNITSLLLIILIRIGWSTLSTSYLENKITPSEIYRTNPKNKNFSHSSV